MEEKIGKGIFLTFEGPEGSGKSTQSELIYKCLASDGYPVLRTFEPGGTELGKKIRDILLDKEDIRLGSLAELLLFEADRAQHMEEVIIPALRRNKIVISDRFNTATFAYQGYGLGMDMEFIGKIDESVRGKVMPDLTIVLDVDVVTGIARATPEGKADRMEKRDMGFHSRVREGYLDIAKTMPEKIKVIDTAGSIGEVHEKVKREVYAFIEGHKRTA
ncbi:MAG: dTMP kinase [Candidatus Omnitrophota bacterium]